MSGHNRKVIFNWAVEEAVKTLQKFYVKKPSELLNFEKPRSARTAVLALAL